MRGGHEQVLGEVIFLGDGPARTKPAPPLGTVFFEVSAFYIALTTDGNDHRLVSNHVFSREVAADIVDFGATCIAVTLPNVFQFGFDNAALQHVGSQYSVQMINQAH